MSKKIGRSRKERNTSKENRKRGASLMISYVLLISIAIALAIAIFSWMKLISNPKPVIECKEGTSLVLDEYSCDSTKKTITLTVRNNGRFNIDGFILTVGNDSSAIPNVYLKPNVSDEVRAGHWFFNSSLKPGKNAITRFEAKEGNGTGGWKEIEFDKIKIIKIQPFVKEKENEVIVVCEEAIFSQDIDCQIK